MSDVQLSGRLVCRNAEEAAIVVAHLPEHIALTRAEPGCLSFDVTATSDPLIWEVEERFRTEDAYLAHSSGSRAATGVHGPPGSNGTTPSGRPGTDHGRTLRSVGEVFAPDRRPPFAAVLTVLNRYDPEGLLAIGAPADEYAPEADDLAGRLRAGRPVTSEVLVETWEHWFGPDSGCVRTTPAARIAELAAEIDALR